MWFVKVDTQEALGYISALFPSFADVLRNNVRVEKGKVKYKKGLVTAEIAVKVSAKGEVILDLSNVGLAGFGGFGAARKLAGDLIVKRLKAYPLFFESVEKRQGNIYLKLRWFQINFIDLDEKHLAVSFRLWLNSRSQ